MLQQYVVATQHLCSALNPSVPARDLRHEQDPTSLEAQIIRYTEGGEESAERKGVLHLAQCWMMQGHPYGVCSFLPCLLLCLLTYDLFKPLRISSDMHTKDSKGANVKEWYRATRPLAIFLGELFKATFPDHYLQYKAAFDAGAWLCEDPGPWLMRVIIWKLDVNIHFDKKDAGPTATFPSGFFEHGAMELPQLRARLVYVFIICSIHLLTHCLATLQAMF